MVIKVQQLKKTSFDRILAFSAEGSDNRRSQDSSLLSIPLEEMGLLDMVYILKRVWGKGKWLSPEGGPCPDQFEIASAATSTEEIWNGVGNPVYPPAREELARHGISCKGKRAVQLTASDYDHYDYLIGMDSMNMRNIERMTGHRRGDKIYKMLEFAGRDADVRDPWYSGNFRETYEDVVEGCQAFLDWLTINKKLSN